MEKGVGGYIYFTLPIVLHSWLRNRDDIKNGIIDVVRCGGDTDTTGAIVGSIIGARVEKLPQKWIDGIVDFPRNVAFIEKVSYELASVFMEKKPKKAPRLSALAMVVRNFLFFVIVLVVGVLRLL